MAATSMISDLNDHQRRRIVDWIGEQPETVLAVGALRSGHGRLWWDGDVSAPSAVLVESPLTPGEPQAFGDAGSIIRCLSESADWFCVEVESHLASELRSEFESRFGAGRVVVDVVHRLDDPVVAAHHPLVRALRATEVLEFPTATEDLIADRAIAARSGASGLVFAAIADGVILGHGGSFAAGERFADVGVAVSPTHRRQGIATACASQVCRVLQTDGLVPIWSTSSENAASLAVARRLGFVEVSRLIYLIREAA